MSYRTVRARGMVRGLYHSYPNQFCPIVPPDAPDVSYLPGYRDAPCDVPYSSRPSASLSPTARRPSHLVPPLMHSVSDSQASLSKRSCSPPVLRYPCGWEKRRLARRKSQEERMPLGENNPNAIPGGKLCFEYMNQGR